MLRIAYNHSSKNIHRCWYSSNISNDINQILKQMSKLPAHKSIVRKQEARFRRNLQKQHPAGKINVQVVGTGASGAPASIYLFSDQSRYLINCGEGTQRLAHEHRFGLARMEHVFLTRTSWRHIGGLPGLSLTLQDAASKNLTLHGPPKLGEIFTAMRRFIVLRKLQVDAPECEEGKFYEDSVLKMTYVPLARKVQDDSEPNQNQALTIDDTEIENIDYYAHEQTGPKAVTPSVPSLHQLAKSEETTVMAYICEMKPKLGTLSLSRCVEKGVPPGPLLGILKNGEDVVLANGEKVLAADVRDPDDPGPVLLVIDTPSCDYLESLIENAAFKTYQNQDDDNRLGLILHFTPEHVANSQEYKEFMSRFPAKTKHWFINERNKSSGYISAHRIQWQLNQLSDEIFPILGEPIEKCLSSDDDSPNKRPKLEENLKAVPEISIDAIAPLSQFNLRPNTGLERTYETYVLPHEYIDETANNYGFAESLTAMRKIQKTLLMNQSDRQEEFPKIVFLGTGSCIPNKTRNVSAILVHITHDNSILLDCGEGTVGQIQRLYGPRADEIMKRIKCVAITHLHADHHLGLFGILQERRRVLGDHTTPVLLLAPYPITSWLNYYEHRIESIANDYVLVPNTDLLQTPLIDSRVTNLGLKMLQTCLVAHCLHAYAFSFTIDPKQINKTEPIKITYSGDTMPCESLVNLGLNSTVLIHEATMEDNLADDAKAKAHSTTSQALDQARKMNATFTILTHFSQRYAKIPRIENDLQNVGIAFDNMEVVLSDFKQLEIMYPILKTMFPEAWDELERKSNIRLMKKVRDADDK